MGRRLPTVAASLGCAAAMGLALAGAPAGVAEAAADRAAARSNSQWLAGQLADDGTLENPMGGVLPDHGLMIDVLLAMYASGDGRLADPIVGYLDDGGHASDYFTWDGLVPDAGFDAIIVGGAAAKVLVAAEVAGRDPRAFDGYDMVAETRAAIMRSGPDKGRVSNYSKNPEYADWVSNDANVFGQSLALIGLAGVGEVDQLAVDTLVTQQCGEGYFRIFFAYVPTDEVGDHVTPNGYKVSTCEEGKEFGASAPDGDATGMALSAMLAARAAGAAGLDEPIDRTVAWLKANQDAGGGWGGGVRTEAPNTNSTGLIVQALAEHGGAEAAVAKGVEYLRGAQVTEADAGTALGTALGAIAYNLADRDAARTTGIVGIDTWIRASAQASLGLSQVGFHALTLGEIPVDPPPTPTPTRTATPTPTPTRTPTAARTITKTVTKTVTVTPSPTATRPLPPPLPPRTSTSPAVPQTGPPPQAGTVSAAGRLGGYLASQLVGGDHVEITRNGETFVDYDATADLVLALRALGEQPAAIGRVTRFLLAPDAIQAYAHGAPYEKVPAAYAEPLAKLQIIARFAQADGDGPADIRQTIGRLAADLAGLGADDGRFVDTGAFADSSQSVRGHAWAILATLADPDSGGATAALDLLIAHQCADGTFPVALASARCATGDLAATAAAVQALNGRSSSQPVPTPEPGEGGGVPGGWSKERVRSLERAAAALAARSGGGIVRGPAGGPDPLLSAIAAGGRQAAGLDASDTARLLSATLRPDGGVAGSGGVVSDPSTSIAVAPGVAGRTWAAAANSPVVMAVRLPLTGAGPPAVPVAVSAADVSIWFVLGLVAAGFLLAVALLLGRRYLVHRNPTAKAVAP
ncbi:hypothetical protein [Rhizomonospora bruguierae]|uniref:hypothetical protein n=1 Tax=Rhizomonospora bruguierae TaxID=1581705 RepID=UPI001BCD98A4|nr:hypothetical protein [Micromonospora sp. NBRC 107566]